MTKESNSVLAQKISSAGLSEPAAPALTDFAAALCKPAQTAVGELLDCKAAISVSSTRLLLQNVIGDSESESDILYWISDRNDARCVLVKVSPPFSGVVTERLLGGGLNGPGEEAAASILDFQMAESLVEVMIPAINQALAKAGASFREAPLVQKRGFRAAAIAGRDIELEPVFQLAIDIGYGEHKAVRAVELLFLTTFLDRIGIQTRGGRARESGADKTSWSTNIRRNMLHTELPLSVVIDRVQSSVGAVSKLQVGDVFDIDPEGLNKLEITVAAANGDACIARARLGALRSRKAVKLTTGVDPDFLRGF